LLHLVGYLRCTKMMHGHTNIKFTVHTVYVVQEINPCLCSLSYEAHNHDTSWQHCRCIVPKAVYAVKKCSWGWANLSPETCRAEL